MPLRFIDPIAACAAMTIFFQKIVKKQKNAAGAAFFISAFFIAILSQSLLDLSRGDCARERLIAHDQERRALDSEPLRQF